MAHFAEIKESNNEVVRVLVFSNEDINSRGGDLSAEAEAWVATTPASVDEPVYWKQTSYNNNFRRIYTGAGHIYDSSDDTFKPSQPYDNWVWDETNWNWKPPIDVPLDENGPYRWDQENTQWVSTKEN